MALRTDSIPTQSKEEKPTGEMRLDSEGKGYWHSFKKDKVVEVLEEKPQKKKIISLRRKK